MKTIGVVTTSRADYGIVLPVLRAIEAEPSLQLRLLVGGTHLVPEFGYTVREIERDGFAIAARLEILLASDSPLGIAKSMGLATSTFAECYARENLDLVIVTGDRFEMHAAAVATLPFRLPLAHLHGGEVTAGAIDDALRHSMTKLSHLHFTATADAAQRVIGMGEEPWRVTVSGAPALDNVLALAPVPAAAIEKRIGMALSPAPLLVTFHPVTLQADRTANHIDELLAALETIAMPVIFTAPNADTAGRIIRERITTFVATHANARLCDSLGTTAYFGLLAHAAAMVGNSSSGIIEAASFGLPVVDVGDRQAGRLRGRNVIDAAPCRESIVAAIRRACSSAFRADLAGLINPYGSGHAAQTIVGRLREVSLDAALLVKRQPAYAEVQLA